MRFLFNFVLFGLIYFAIYYYFPDAFHTLVEWVAKIFDFLKDVITALVEKLNNWRTSSGMGTDKVSGEGLKSIFQIFMG